MKTAVTRSIAGHIVFVIAMLVLSISTGDGDKEDKKDKGKGDGSVEVTIIPKIEGPGVAKKCKSWYGGIGIWVTYRLNEQTGSDEIIKGISEGYAADKAGLQINDVILGVDSIRGDPGTKLTLKIERGNTVFTIDLIREKICTEN